MSHGVASSENRHVAFRGCGCPTSDATTEIGRFPVTTLINSMAPSSENVTMGSVFWNEKADKLEVPADEAALEVRLGYSLNSGRCRPDHLSSSGCTQT